MILLSVLSAFILAMAAGAALAGDKIGVIEPQTVLSQHPKMPQVKKQIQAMLQKKQEEAKAAIEKETDNEKKAEIYQTKKNEAAAEEQKLMAPILKDMDQAIRNVAKAKGLTVVIDVAQALMGGVDITNDVIAELKRTAVN
ncbi:MAG: OmpH family outer membrane protein [Synergistaceae bacterium]|nr:OmpH family outer membrane protein [Synergistaceae bacterium]